MEIQFGNIGGLIHLAITPAVLLVGIGTQLRVLTNRLASVTNRSRAVEGSLAENPTLRKAEYEAELRILYRRMDIIHRAVTLSTACALLICLVIIALFADMAFALHVARPVIGVLFTFAMLALIGSFGLFLREIFVATDALLSSIRRKLGDTHAVLPGG